MTYNKSKDANGGLYNKYKDETGYMLNEIAMDGFADQECGSVSEYGIWSALILEHKAIIQEDEQGFFDYKIFNTEQESQEEFDRIESMSLDIRLNRLAHSRIRPFKPHK